MNITCIVCPAGCNITVSEKDGEWITAGNTCSKGRDFAISEATNPTRSLTSTVRTADPDMPRLPVRTDGEIPLNLIFKVMDIINSVEVKSSVNIGDVIIPNVLETGINVISTGSM